MIRYDWRGPRPCAVCGYARKGRHLPVELCGLRPCPDPSKHHRFVLQPDPFHAEPRRTIVTDMALAWCLRNLAYHLAALDNNSVHSVTACWSRNDHLAAIRRIWHAAREEQE